MLAYAWEMPAFNVPRTDSKQRVLESGIRLYHVVFGGLVSDSKILVFSMHSKYCIDKMETISKIFTFWIEVQL